MLASITLGGRARSRWSGALAHHFARRLVVAQAEEPGVAQAPSGGPLAEPELCDELRHDPVDAPLADRPRVRERGRVPSQRTQLLAERSERLIVKAGPDLARVSQLVAVVVAEQQCPEVGPRAPAAPCSRRLPVPGPART